MELDLNEVRQTFLVEADEGLAEMEEALVALETRPDDMAPLHAVFRIVHTIKGSAAIVGFDNVSEFAHLLEDALERFRTGVAPITPAQVTILLQSVDLLRGILKAAANGNTTHVRSSDRALVARLLPSGDLGSGAAAQSSGLSASPRQPGARGRTLRVDMQRLDALLDLTGEIAVARGWLLQVLAHRDAGNTADALVASEELDRLFVELQQQVMRMRMVSLGPVFRQHIRTVRDVAAARGKAVRLVLEGEDVEVDASVVDHLRDPLTHMVRNATDHGIELPPERQRAGKEACGTITLRARHEGGMVVIQVEDDGAGLDRARILERARTRHLVPEGITPSDAELDRLVFEPGFSTAATITDLSGRGVGMDVVRRNVEALRGSIGIESTPGAGTTITIRLPLTVAIIDGFTVTVAGERYVIPLDAVTECLELPAERSDAGTYGIVSLRGEPLPYLRMRGVFGLDDARPARENIVVVRHAGRSAGLVVDGLLGEGQAVVKPLGAVLQRLPAISASTIMGDGRVALILDIPELLQRAHRAGAAA